MTKQFKILYRTVIIFLAVGAAMLAGALILWTIGADVTKTYSVIIFEPLKNRIQVGEVIIRAIPLSVIALGISVAYRSGIINIGAEGQMAMGILAATAVASLSRPGEAVLPLALTAGLSAERHGAFYPASSRRNFTSANCSPR